MASWPATASPTTTVNVHFEDVSRTPDRHSLKRLQTNHLVLKCKPTHQEMREIKFRAWDTGDAMQLSRDVFGLLNAWAAFPIRSRRC